MKSPPELGLPAKFAAWYPYQEEVLEWIMASKAKFLVLQAPTGSGKTVMAAGLQRLTKSQTLYTCTSKDLQDQVARDFPFAAVLKGRANYGGLVERTAEDCTREPHCSNCCDQTDDEEEACAVMRFCPYQVAKKKAVTADFPVLNLPMWLYSSEYSKILGVVPWVVMDEADLIEQAVMGFVSVEIGKRNMERWGLKSPKITVEEDWYEWGRERLLPAIENELRDSRGLHQGREVQRAHRLSKLRSRVLGFLGEEEVSWVFDPESVAFRPVSIERLTGDLLWAKGKRFLLMSATILAPGLLSSELGIPFEEMDFHEIGSVYPAGLRPVHYQPCADVSFKNKEVAYPQLVAGIDRILNEHTGDKGIVHAVSYELARYIIRHSSHASRMLIPADSSDRSGVIDRFKRTSKPAILVAPAMERGLDLPHDECRVLIVAKVPWPNRGDRQVAARAYGTGKRGRSWYVMQAVRSLVQATGRGVRGKDDWCYSYILDRQFGQLWSDHRNLFPKWWREGLQL